MAGTSNYVAILAALVALIDSASGVENVYGYQRHVADWKALMDLFKVATGVAPNQTFRVHGWTVSRSAVEEEWLTNVECIRTHTFKVRGFYGVQDSANTEASFNALLEAIGNTCRADFTASATAEWRDPLSFQTIDHRIFGGILCHYAEGTCRVRERILGGA